jgi:GR25 family glycosyltransferase involved in LPS biosynthesis
METVFQTEKIKEYCINTSPDHFHALECEECKTKNSTYDWSWSPIAFCISLKERDDRVRIVSKEFHKVGLCNKIVFYRPLKDKSKIKRPGTRGCWESHRAVAKIALECNLDHAIVFEDDVVFDEDFTPENSIVVKQAFQSLPKKWNVFFLGHTSVMSLPFKKNIIRTWSLATHAYVISKNQMIYLANRMYDDHPFNKISSIDYDLANVFARKNTFAMYPMIAYQDNSTPSDNQAPLGAKTKKIVDWVISQKTMKKSQYRSFWILIVALAILSSVTIVSTVVIVKLSKKLYHLRSQK